MAIRQLVDQSRHLVEERPVAALHKIPDTPISGCFCLDRNQSTAGGCRCL